MPGDITPIPVDEKGYTTACTPGVDQRVGAGGPGVSGAADVTEPRQLDEHDVVLCRLVLPAEVRLMTDMVTALDHVGRRHGLQPAVLLFDGTNRVVARRVGAPARAGGGAR